MRIMGIDIRRAPSPEEEAEELPLRKRLQRLEIAFNELVEHHSTLAAAHAKLRNQFHGMKGGRPAASSDAPRSLSDIPVGDKAALRRALGVVPGSRYQHRSDEQ